MWEEKRQRSHCFRFSLVTILTTTPTMWSIIPTFVPPLYFPVFITRNAFGEIPITSHNYDMTSFALCKAKIPSILVILWFTPCDNRNLAGQLELCSCHICGRSPPTPIHNPDRQQRVTHRVTVSSCSTSSFITRQLTDSDSLSLSLFLGKFAFAEQTHRRQLQRHSFPPPPNYEDAQCSDDLLLGDVFATDKWIHKTLSRPMVYSGLQGA